MTEPKTLKDIEYFESYIDIEDKIVYSERLRAEAAKWIKLLISEDDYNKNDYMSGFCLKHMIVDKCEDSLGISWAECSDIPAVVNFIKHFFNLTEADIK